MFLEWTVLWYKHFYLCNLRPPSTIIFGYNPIFKIEDITGFLWEWESGWRWGWGVGASMHYSALNLYGSLQNILSMFPPDSFLVIIIFSTWSIETQEDMRPESESLRVHVQKGRDSSIFTLLISRAIIKSKSFCISFWKQSGFEA